MAAPYIPQNIVVMTGNGQIYLVWDLVIGATSYVVQRSTDGINFTSAGTPSTNNFLDATVSVGVAYYYQVAAANVSGTSPYGSGFPTATVPCLPGQVNLGYLIYQSKLRADKLNSEYLTLDEWAYNVNQTALELYDILVSKYGDNYFFAPPLQFTLSGQQSYPLPNGGNYQLSDNSFPPAVYKLSGVDVNINSPSTVGPNQGWVPVPKANWSDRDRSTMWPGATSALNGAYGMAYRPMGNNLFIFPQNINQTIQIWYVPVLAKMLQLTDMMPFSISGWEEYVIVKAAMLAMSKEESSEKYALLQSQLNTQIERIETQAANRDVDQPNTVSNVRQTMSDPGFGGFGGGFGNGFGF